MRKSGLHLWKPVWHSTAALRNKLAVQMICHCAACKMAFVGSSIHHRCVAERTGLVTFASLCVAADFGTQLLLFLLIPFSTPLYFTIFKMLFMWGVLLRTSLALLSLACSLLAVGPPCLVKAMLFLLWRLLPLLRLCVNICMVPTIHALHCPRAALSAGVVN